MVPKVTAPNTFGPGDLVKGLGSMAAFTGAFALPGHLRHGYRVGAMPTASARGGGVLGGLKGMGRSVTTAQGLGSLAGKTGKWTWQFLKHAPKWAAILGIPMGLLGAYMSARQKGDTSAGGVLGQFGKELDARGKAFGETTMKGKGTLGLATNLARGYFLEPEAAAAHLYQRYLQ